MWIGHDIHGKYFIMNSDGSVAMGPFDDIESAKEAAGPLLNQDYEALIPLLDECVGKCNALLDYTDSPEDWERLADLWFRQTISIAAMRFELLKRERESGCKLDSESV